LKPKPLPPLNALKAFECVSRYVNVSRAAQELSVTPSAVSHLLRRLEDNLGVNLVERSGRNIQLTETGVKLGAELQEVFHSLRNVVSDVLDSLDQDVVTVSLRPYFAVKWLAPRLGSFWTRHPEIQLHLHHSNEETDFLSSKVDFAIEWSKGERPGVDHQLLVPGDLTPVYSPDLCNEIEIRRPVDLTRFPLLRETDYDSWSEWFHVCNTELPEKIHSIYIDDSNVRYQAALDGQGVELSCRMLISEDLSSGNLIAPFDHFISDFSYYLVKPGNRTLSDSAQIFREWVIEQS
jgi:LysR family glycine cleavage system transcriptional activator